MVRNVPRLVLAVNSVLKALNRVEKIPICVAVNNATRGFHCSLFTVHEHYSWTLFKKKK